MLLHRAFSIAIGTAALSLGFAGSAQAQALYYGNMNGQVGFPVAVPLEGNASTPPGCLALPTPQIGRTCDNRGVGMPGPTSANPRVAKSLTGMNPASFRLGPGSFFISASYVRQTVTPPFIQSSSVATWSNGAGIFAKGGGWAAGTFNPPSLMDSVTTLYGSVFSTTFTPPGSVVFNPGVNQFGGTMRILGVFLQHFASITPGGVNALWFPSQPLLPSFIGGPYGNQVRVVNPGYFVGPAVSPTTVFQITSTPANFTGFPWGTGTISVRQNAGLISSFLTETGMDNRNAAGTSGSLKMVTGWMTHFGFAGGLDENVGEYEINLTFVPEPGSSAMLAAGIALLGVIYRVRTRSR